jgi:energy-coupling factor transporter ATP-binding protein EcfA2
MIKVDRTTYLGRVTSLKRRFIKDLKNGGVDFDMKYALFIVGRRKSGKSTIIRSLTGLGRIRRGHVWNVKARNGQLLKALVLHSSPQELSTRKYPPAKFPDVFEKELGVSRDKYDLLISALELDVRDPKYSYQEYVENIRSKGFDVRIAVIKTCWNGEQEEQMKIQNAQEFAQKLNIPLMLIDSSDDPNVVANT